MSYNPDYSRTVSGVIVPVLVDEFGTYPAQLLAASENGKVFTASSGKQSAGVNAAAQLWIPSSTTKNVVIFSVELTYANAANMHQVQLITASDANIATGTNHASPTPTNLNPGSSVVAQGQFTYCTAIANTGVATGSAIAVVTAPVNQTMQALLNGRVVYIPAGTAAGVAVYLQTTAAGQFGISMSWLEFSS